MFRHLTSSTLDRITAHPKRVLAAFLLLTAVAVLLGARIEFRDSRSDLAAADDPEQARFQKLIDDFNGSEALVVAVEPVAGVDLDPLVLRRFTDELAKRIGRLSVVDTVFHRVEVERLLVGSLWSLPPQDLVRTVDQVEELLPGLQALLGRFGPEALTRFIDNMMQSGAGAALTPEDREEGIGRLVELLAVQKRFLENPEELVSRLEHAGLMQLLAAGAGESGADGYLATSDGRTLFLFVSPADTSDALPAQRALVDAVRQAAALLVLERPGFQIGLTGQPALVVEEMAAISTDTWKTSALAIAGVLLLTLLVFRWKFHAVLVLAALATGVALALGAVYLELGYLNLITSSFISTLIGVGIAYGIHPVSEYELMGAHTVPPEESVKKAYRHTGAAVTTAGVTTAAAFFSIVLMDFKGFAELGVVAGGGVLLCLLSALVLLPALLVLHARYRRKRGVGRTRAQVTAAMDRLWLERGAVYACRFPRTVSVIALMITAAALWSAFGIRFDTNILKLVPAGLESVRYQEKMTSESEFSPVFSVVAVDRPDELEAIRSGAEGMDSILRVDSLLRFLPVDPDRSSGPIKRLATLVRSVPVSDAEGGVDAAGLLEALSGLADRLADAADDAFGAGLGGIAGSLEEALETVEDSAALVQSAGPEQVARWDAAVPLVETWLIQARAELIAASETVPPGPSDLPESIRSRFMTRSGRFLAFLQPAGDVFDPRFLEGYVKECRTVSRESTGFPIVFHHMSRRITSGFYRAVAVGAVMVFLVLLLDYRRLGPALLALVPLLVGMIWMLGCMRLLNLQFNFANLVAVPLIIGVGIDNGVHIVHRLLYEGDEGMSIVLRHTGRAILIASLTTMIGFGSLAFASHRGMSGLGLILLLGVGACLITSTVVLPNLLVATGRVRR